MNDVQEIELGPVDYLLVEWPGRQPTGKALPHLIDLVERGLIRVLDLAFITKGKDGFVSGVEFSELVAAVPEFSYFQGASSGLIQDDDLEQAAEALEPGTSAALLIFENKWAAPFATALRSSGGQLVAGGRIPVQDLLVALDATETTV